MPSLRSRTSAVRPRVRAITWVLTPLIISTLAGCYTYRPLASTAVPARVELRLYFTADGAKSLRDSAGFELRQLDGKAVRTLADTALVVLPSDVITTDGIEVPWRRGELVVPWRAVERSQQRTMDKRKTRGFVAVMGAVFTGVVYFALKSISSGSGATLQGGSGVPE